MYVANHGAFARLIFPLIRLVESNVILTVAYATVYQCRTRAIVVGGGSPN